MPTIFDDDEEEVCEYCNGTGLRAVDYRNSDGNVEPGTGEEICICKLLEE